MDHPEFRTLIENADDALAQGDFTRLMEFYADDATLVVKQGDVVTGRIAILRALQTFSALSGGRSTVRRGRIEVVQGGATALVMVETSWELPAPEGYELSLTRTAAFVFKRTGRGWRCVIENVHGAGF